MDASRRALFRGRFSNDQPVKSSVSIQMPWMVSTDRFTDQCTRCAKCVDACPENIIIKGDGGFPTVDFKSGECTFCGDCVDVCEEPIFNERDAKPWSLIALISEQPASSTVSFDGSCMAKQGVICQSCKDVCDARAIRLEYKTASIPFPVVSQDTCTGCGACVSVCPTLAISVIDLSATQENNALTSPQNKGAELAHAIS